VRRVKWAHGKGMQQFIKHFVRDKDGAWRCIEPAELVLPQGRVQVTRGSVFTRGTKFMNVDLAEMLDEQFETYRRPSKPPSDVS